MKKEIQLAMKSIKHKNFQIQKQVFCHYCASYKESVHYSPVKKCHINRNNKVIIEAKTEAAAQRKGNEDIYGDYKIKPVKKFMEMDVSHWNDSGKWHKEMKEEKKRMKNRKKNLRLLKKKLRVLE